MFFFSVVLRRNLPMGPIAKGLSGPGIIPDRQIRFAKLRSELNCGATLLVNMRDIEPRKEDDGFDGAFLSP